MRISILLLFVSVFSLYAENTAAQNTIVSIEKQNASLSAIFDEIEKQTDYLFVYNKLVDVDRIVSIKQSKTHLKNVLDQLFNNSDVSYAMEGSYIVLSNRADIGNRLSSTQQNRKVSGTVLDEEGKPLSGVSITLKGQANVGAMTSIDGDFTLSIPENSSNTILVFSYIGFLKQEVNVGNKSSLNIILQEDITQIEEVVVIGYGVVKKSDLTGSIGSIKVDNIKGVSVKSVDQMLQGRSSGLHMVKSSGMPGAGATVRIRGGNSISGGNEPLYIIDGVPVYPSGSSSQTALNPLNTIPTSDIESIEVLKDASSTAIYGARGANGVIIITTKTGKAGKTKVSFETYLGIQNIAKSYNLLDASTFEKLSNEALINSGGAPIYDENVFIPTTDWQELTRNKNALIQNYQLTVSGGNEKSSFLTTLNIYDQDGTIKATDMRKYAFRTNLDIAIASSIKMGINLTMTKVDYNSAGNGVLMTRLTTPPNLPVYQDDGSYTMQGAEAGVIMFDNPVGVIHEKKAKNAQFRTLDNLFAEWDIIKGLKLKSSLGLDITFADANSYNPRTLYTGNIIGGDAMKTKNSSTSWINENILSYINTWGMHSVSALVGYTQQTGIYDNLKGTSRGHLTDILEMNNLAAGTVFAAESSKTKWVLNSYLARLNYTLNSKYLFTASLRADGSSRFGKNNRWGYFPSGAVAWRASEESFIKNSKIFTTLKPRISFGVTGNQDGIGVYPSYALLGTSGYQIGGDKFIGYQPAQVANNNLKWETTTQVDGGIDLGFFDNRLTLTFDAYYKKTNDLLLRVTVPSTSGFTSGLKNIGKVENRGYEIGISATPVVGRFTWNSGFNITFNKNKVLDLGGSPQIFPSQPGMENSGIHLGRIVKVGESLGTFYGYVYDGIFSSTDDIASSAQKTAKPGDIRFKDVSGPDGKPDGQINDLDRTIIGCAQPKFFGGFSNDFSYKNFDLNINMIFSYGNDIYNGTKVSMEDMQGSTNLLSSAINRWTPENQSGNLPRMLRSKAVMRVSSQYVEKGSYLRFQNITLGYNVPTAVLDRTKYVSKLRIYASLQDFFTITSYSGNNPDVSNYGQDNLGSGYDSFPYPLSKVVMFGLNVTF